MTMLTNIFGRPPHASRRQDVVEADAANDSRETIRQFCRRTLGVLMAGAILAAIIGLDAAFYVRTLSG
jgi:hypothetical protein